VSLIILCFRKMFTNLTSRDNNRAEVPAVLRPTEFSYRLIFETAFSELLIETEKQRTQKRYGTRSSEIIPFKIT